MTGAARAIRSAVRRTGGAGQQGETLLARGLEEALDADLQHVLYANGYTDLRRIGDAVCGLHRFNFTTGLVVALDHECYGRRYCYEYEADARIALLAWDGIGHPSGPWIKAKGSGLDLFNPALIA